MQKILLILAMLFSTCAAHAADDVKVRFSWKLKGEYAPFYLAEESGAYARRNLAVHMGEGAGAPAALAALLQGQEDLVVLPGIFAIDAIERGMPIELIAIYHPQTPIALVGQPGSTLRTPADMMGKKMATSVGATGATYLPPFCAINKIDCSKIVQVQMNSSVGQAAFLQGQLDMGILYLNVELPLYEEKTGKTYPVLRLSDWGMAIPGLAIVASKAGIQRRADVFRRVLAANDEAIAAAAKHPDAAASALEKVWSGAPSHAVIEKQVKVTMAAIVPDVAGKPVGWIDPARIAFSRRILLQGQASASAAPDSAFFTNELLPRAPSQ
jgi:NitT/TauT family transport system substrate-binding protein